MYELDEKQKGLSKQLYDIFLLVNESLSVHQQHNEDLTSGDVELIQDEINEMIEKKIKKIKNRSMEIITAEIYDPYYRNRL